MTGEDQEEQRLAAYFAARWPDEKVSISDYKRSASGHSNETRLFTLTRTKDGAASSQNLVARWAPSGAQSHFQDYDIAFQYRILVALAKNGIPVPEVILYEPDTSIVGSDFFVMARIDGDVTSDYPPGYHGHGFLFEASVENRAKVWWRALEVMARVNLIDWHQPEFDFMDRPASGTEAVRKQLALYRKLADWASETPIEPIERALDWLEANVPAAPPLALCWSDGRPGNIIYQDYEPAAALDWETAYIGPPENDLAWFWLVDEVAYVVHQQKRLEGLPSLEETTQRFSELLGRPLQDLDYYFVMQGVWMAIMMAISAKTYIARGIEGFPEDYATNNFSVQRLEQLLEKAS
ncbi:phosphotransferase family protein [Novosphingobium malaysiense]|uniref:Aminoglycoside phosphotransferase domain-containing protein n=1 Tax=Novosphingobium malaysiense TaxID=1348853 RepID=A0A0B1ZIE9_9SPHN|nr:phosphotransferase family protein [Novosphingobium malaysiense]KHK89053.1 hypothetical protein LK12_22110 [Novosphingobium malaysiense]